MLVEAKLTTFEGTVRQVAIFHTEALKYGMAIVGGVPPATPFW